MKTVAMTVRISPGSKEKFEKICRQEHRSQSAQIEYWISQFKLNEEKKDN